MKFAVGVTLYNPEREQVERLVRLTESFDKVFLFDNSDRDVCGFEIPVSEKIHLISENGNRGLPYAFNKIIQQCTAFDFLCTMDQDSLFEADDISKMKTFIETSVDIRHIGVVAPFIDYGHQKYAVSDKLEKKTWVITSGSFVNLKVLRDEGVAYDDAYFIDKFEIDLCQQLLKRGFSVLMYHGATLHQALGEESGHNHPNHNELRHYYIFRNRFYFNNKWHYGFVKFFLNVTQTLRHVTLITLYENKKLVKLKMLKTAFYDYRHQIMGKKECPKR